MDTVSVDELRAMFASPEPEVRWLARMLVLLAVGGYRDEGARAWDELDAMLTDPDPVVRQRAETARVATVAGDLDDHLQVVLEILADDMAADAWAGCVAFLGELEPGQEFDTLVTVLARTTSAGQRDRLACRAAGTCHGSAPSRPARPRR